MTKEVTKGSNSCIVGRKYIKKLLYKIIKTYNRKIYIPYIPLSLMINNDIHALRGTNSNVSILMGRDNKGKGIMSLVNSKVCLSFPHFHSLNIQRVYYE